MSSKQVLLVSALFGCFLSHFSPVFAQNRPYTTQQALIPTYYQQQHQSQQQATAHAQSQSNPTYLTYHPHHHPNPTFYHQNVYLASPQQSSAVAAQSQASPQQAGAYYYGAPAGAANLYTYGAQSPGGGGGAMMVASSSSQAVLTAIPPPTSGHSEHQDPSQSFSQATPADYASGTPSGPKGTPTSTVGPSGAQLGIAFGRPMGGYDGNYYVPVFYPLSWLGNSDPMAAYSSNTHQTTLSSPYGHQTPLNAQAVVPPTRYPMTVPAYFPQSLASAVTYPNYRMMLPQSHPYHQHLQQRPYHPQLSTSAHPKSHFTSSVSSNPPAHSPADEMMPSDVNPDMNGNFKRVSAYSDAASYFFGDPQALLGPQGVGPEPVGSIHEGRDEQSTADGTNAYYYLAPVLKYRDPKDDYNLAIEANKEQMHAQARFEKEVLMSEEMMPGAEYQQHQHQEHQPGPGAYSSRPGSYSSSARDSINPLLDPRTGMASPSSLYSNHTSHIEARSGRDQATSGAQGSAQGSALAPQSKPNTNERPILTQIEIYDLPGANKYLGLSDAQQQVAPAPSNATEVVPIFAPAPTPLKTHKLPYSALPAAKFYKRKIESMKPTKK